MNIILKIQRNDPRSDEKPYFKEYRIEVNPDDRILDLLLYIKRFRDGTLGFRMSCAHGICGSDAMIINGKERLACKVLVKELVTTDGDTIEIKPLRYLPVQRDLMVDQTIFFDKYRLIKPFLINEEPSPEKEWIQSPEERKRFDDATNCILCAACYSACPVIEKNPEFLGPAAIVQAARFNDDSRDRGFEMRLPALDEPNGVWPCENHFQCTVVCPRYIKVTKLINLTKNRIKKYRLPNFKSN